MKTREELIEEMAKAINTTGVALDGTDYAFGVYADDDHFHRTASALYDAGYRKQSDIVREFVERLFAKIRPMYFSLIGRNVGKIIDELAKEYGVECHYLVQLIEYMSGQGADTISNPKTGEKWTFGKED